MSTVFGLPFVSFAQLNAQLVVAGLDQSVGYYADPNMPSQAFALEKAGKIKIVSGGTASTMLDQTSSIDSSGERGFLGFAYAPDYATTKNVYLSYTDPDNKGLNVVRMNTASGFNWDARQLIINVPHPMNLSNHNGGNIRFGPDNKLYIGTGDGGGGNDPDNHAQDLHNDLGKILRIDVSGVGPGYTVPGDNPFVGIDGNDEIWAFGVRNPWRYSFDQLTGDLYIGDVGQDNREEIDRSNSFSGGQNYGWRVREGDIHNPANGDPNPPNLTDPIYVYDHTVGHAITGGYVYRGSELGSHYYGRYFFGDSQDSRLWSIDPNAANIGASLEEYTSGLSGAADFVVSIDADSSGELYLTSFNGSVSKLTAVPEPGTLVALGLGVGLLVRRKRKVRQSA